MQELFLKSAAQVAISLRMLKDYHKLVPDLSFKEVCELTVTPIKREIKLGNPISANWDYEVIFTAVGSAALNELKDSINVETFSYLLLSKHQQYGSKPLTEWGPIGIVIRIDSKINRYLNLSTLDSVHDYESIYDTLVDILGYCVLGLNYPYPGRQPPHGQIEERIQFLNNLIALKNAAPFHPLFPYDNSK